jgi:hypothetical protein
MVRFQISTILAEGSDVWIWIGRNDNNHHLDRLDRTQVSVETNDLRRASEICVDLFEESCQVLSRLNNVRAARISTQLG